MYDPPCSLKTYNDFLCESPQREESFLNEKHPYNNAEQPAQKYEPHNTSVSSPLVSMMHNPASFCIC